MDREKVIKSLKELENEYNKGNISKNHYTIQKSQLNQQLDAFNVADRVRKLQGKEVAEKPIETPTDEEENQELFKKYITSPGLKEKNINTEKVSPTTMIAAAVLIAAFVIGIGFGIYALNIPENISGISLFTNDSAFPPFVVNNTTNMTNTTNTTKKINITTTPKPVTPTPITPTPTPTPTPNGTCSTAV
ncbi:MAG: hypothetical protein HZC47_02190 [Methanobacterium sp.]|uniref:hypothetical protein n=1 Tax=Methanobacterium sp. TaxID=2164 RepID=UPI003D65029D|nr:hypothetical protein [Methanobacterium sp.]